MPEVIVRVEAVVEQDAEAMRRGLSDCNAGEAIGRIGIVGQSSARLGAVSRRVRMSGCSIAATARSAKMGSSRDCKASERSLSSWEKFPETQAAIACCWAIWALVEEGILP